VDIAWRDGKLTEATVRRVAGGSGSRVVRYGGGTCEIDLAEGASRVLRVEDFASGGAMV
jgi:hypothetical protein